MNDNSLLMRDLIAFYDNAGVDVWLEEAPIDRFQQSAEQAETSGRAAQKPSPIRPSAPVVQRPVPSSSKVAEADESVVASAETLSANADTLEALREVIENFDGCALKRTARTTVFADGSPDADLMIIGEAPGAEEDAQGLPFVGRSGQLLNRMLAAIGLDREQAYITNVIPWRPERNRTPTPAETAICLPFVERHIALAQPKVVLLLGAAASRALLRTESGILSLRGRWATLEIEGGAFPVLPSLHPAFLLRQPAQKRLAWHDLLQVRRRLAETSE